MGQCRNSIFRHLILCSFGRSHGIFWRDSGVIAGTAIGTVAGAVNAATSIYQKKDDAFKGYVQEQYNTVTQTQSDALTNGIAIAGKHLRPIRISKYAGKSP